jgi:hypothetical protein
VIAETTRGRAESLATVNDNGGWVRLQYVK